MKFSYTKYLESDFFYKESKSNKIILAVGRGGGGSVARVKYFFIFFSKDSKSEIKRIQV